MTFQFGSCPTWYHWGRQIYNLYNSPLPKGEQDELSCHPSLYKAIQCEHNLGELSDWLLVCMFGSDQQQNTQNQI